MVEPFILEVPKYHHSNECHSETLFKVFKDKIHTRIYQNVHYDGEKGRAVLVLGTEYSRDDFAEEVTPESLRSLAKILEDGAKAIEGFRKRTVEIHEEE